MGCCYTELADAGATMNKNFDDWNELKKRIDAEHEPPLFNEREIWWCSVGINVGYETFGKGGSFTRPVLVIRKHGLRTFLGVPLTSQPKKTGLYYHPIITNGINGHVLLGQFRIMDSKRLVDLMGKIGKKQHDEIREALRKLT